VPTGTAPSFRPAPAAGTHDAQPKAVTATASKIAALFYNTLRNDINHVDLGADYYEQRYQQRVLNMLTRRAESAGYNPTGQSGLRSESFSEKVSGAVRGRGRMTSPEERATLQELIGKATTAGACQALACAMVG
jgi:hypothetical protein